MLKKTLIVILIFNILIPTQYAFAKDSITNAAKVATDTIIINNSSTQTSLDNTPIQPPENIKRDSIKLIDPTIKLPTNTAPADPEIKQPPDQTSDKIIDSTVPPELEAPITDTPTINSENPQLFSSTQSGRDTLKEAKAPFESSKFKVDTDSSTGALIMNFPLTLPPGRNGLTPELSLNYNSQNLSNDNIFGYGWDLDIPYIVRRNEYGVDYSGFKFYSSMSGNLNDNNLHVGNNMRLFYPEVNNGEYIVYMLNETTKTWEFTNKFGETYKFGWTLDSTEATGPEYYYKVYLNEIRNVNGDFISYEYTGDSGKRYISKIKYGNTGNSSLYEILFNKELRSDTFDSYYIGVNQKIKYRINQIEIKVNGEGIRKYDIYYGSGDNGKRSLLTKIVESAKPEGGTYTSLPAYEFSYTKNQAATFDLNFADNFLSPSNVFFFNPEDNQGDNGVRMVDVNGDGYDDIIQGKIRYDTNASINKIYINKTDDTGWIENPNYTLNQSIIGPTGQDRGLRIADINGDRLLDLLYAPYSPLHNEKKVYINQGTNPGWTLNQNYNIPVEFTTEITDNGVRIADINGDGLMDVLWSNYTNNKCFNNTIYNNNGPSIPVNFYSERFKIADINGDGLDDIIKYDASLNDFKIYISDGKCNFIYNANYKLPNILKLNNRFDNETRIVDINNDGLSDLIFSGYGAQDADGQTKTKVYLNKGDGTGWNETPSYILDLAIDSDWYFILTPSFDSNSAIGSEFTDVNGDGLIDLTCLSAIFLNNNITPDLLNSITNNSGGTTTVEYKSSTKYKNTSGTLSNPKLSLVIQTVSKIIKKDSVQNSQMETNYEYEGGSYYSSAQNIFNGKFAGFNVVTKTDESGFKTKEYFHQGNTVDTNHNELADSYSKIGKKYAEEVYDNSNKVYLKTFYKWDDNGNLVDTKKMIYDGDSDYKTTAESYTYDNYYNIISHNTYGEVSYSGTGDNFTDIGSDKYTINTTYSTYTTWNWSGCGLPSSETTLNQNSAKIKETKYYYDNLAYGSADKGNLTKVENLKSGTTYISTTKTYNTLGLITDETDPRENHRYYTYDQYNLFPAIIKNQLNQQTSYTYDYSSGAVKTETRPNGDITEIQYDAFDRPLTIKETEPQDPYALKLNKKFQYYDSASPKYYSETDFISASSGPINYKYFDGLGRTIQEKQEIEDPSIFSTKSYYYNSSGLLQKETLPYSDNSGSYSSSTQDNNLNITYEYDALNRIKKITNNLGSVNQNYDQSDSTITDEEGNYKNFQYDAYGNLIKVVEYMDGRAINTSYQYNIDGNITNLTDANGNIQNFVYDNLGNLTQKQDLHTVNDTTFGVTNYTYDNTGNLTSKVNPNNQTINYTYDALNRLTEINYTGQTGVEETFTYDNCTFGTGRLCSYSKNNYTVSYNYSPTGLILSETKTIEGTPYTTAYSYDYQGNVNSIILPDASRISYIPYSTGNVLGILYNNNPVITKINYTVNNLPKKIFYRNGTITENTFDPQKLDRLVKKETKKGTTYIQNMAYEYDKVGNILRITDTSPNEIKRKTDYVYDDLYRLTSANTTDTYNNSSNYSQIYQYNDIGNIINKSDKGAYVYNGNQGQSFANPHAVTAVGPKQYAYDKNGNALNNTLCNLTWDYDNRLMQSTCGNSMTNYLYDETGERIKQSNRTSSVIYINKYFEIRNDKINKYIYLNDENLASIVPSPQKKNYSLNFDGTSDLIKTPLNTVQSQTGASYTFEAWIYPTSISAGRHQIISTDNGGFDWGILRNAGKWNVFTGTSSYDTGFNVDLNKWQHVTAVFTPRVGVKFYKNDQEKIISEISYDSSVSPITIGKNASNNNTEYFDGKIDEIKIWNTAKTKDDIINSLDRVLTGQEANLLAYYNFNEGKGQTINNSTLTNNGILGISNAIENSDPIWTLDEFPYKYYANKTITCDGIDDIATTQFNVDQSQTSTGYTFEAWVYPTSISQGRHQLISTDNEKFDWSILRNGNKWNVFTGTSSYDTKFDIDLNKWQHIAATFIPGTGIKFYKNGVEEFINEIEYNNSDTLMTICSNLYPKYKDFFSGKIDEFRIWDKIRTKEDIMNNKDKTLVGNESGLLHYWQFDEGQGQISNDVIGILNIILGTTDQAEIKDPVWNREEFPR
ncbi:MAG: LamG-like jellyroll fold domain-containing protein [Candidatus Gracilibacteria bacterium]|jgi:YD repeat-containing protein